MNRVLVTGAGGSLGGALTACLQAIGAEVHCTDRFSKEGPRWRECDLADSDAVGRLLGEVRPDQIFHLAGTFSNELETDFRNNVLSSRNLMDSLCQLGSKARILLVGSAAEYGLVSANENPIREGHPLMPVSIYGWSKASQTLLMEYYHRVRGVDVVLARLFNLLGAGLSSRLFPGHVREQIAKLRRGEIRKIAVGGLESVRDYLPVEQAASMMEAVMRLGNPGEIYNVGSGKPLRMRDLLETILAEECLGWEQVDVQPRPVATAIDIPVIYAELSKFRSLRTA